MEKYTEEKPWGSFEQFTFNEQSTVKLIHVNPHQQLSLQYHKNREEFWRVLEGDPTITIGEKKYHAKKGDEFFIPKSTNHRIKANESNVTILEISLGTFDENDIVRIEDIYNRS